MDITQRRIYYTLFIALFLLSAPLLIFFAAGFRYDFSTRSFFETGTLVVKSQPSEALIFLNGEPTGFRTPHTFNRLEPQSLQVTLTKDGFVDWSYAVTLQGGKSVLLEDVLLVSEKSPTLLLPGAVNLSVSPSGEKVLMVSSQNNTLSLSLLSFSLLQRATPTPETVAQLAAEKCEILDWSAQEEEILFASTISGQRTFSLLSLHAPYVVTPLPFSSVGNVVFDQRDAGFLFVENIDSTIDRVDRASLVKTRQSFSGQILTQDSEGLFIIEDSSLFLHQRSTSEHTLLSEIHGASLAPYRSSDRSVAIVDPGNALLFIERENGSVITVERIQKNVLGADWLTKDKLLFWTELELWVWDRATRQHTLVTRSSESILTAAWHVYGNAAFVSTSEGTFLWDLAEIKRETAPTLAPFSAQSLFVHPRGLSLYLMNDEGLVVKDLR